jgi:hypothetical protein
MELVEGWMKFFGLKSANAFLTNLSHEEFHRVAKGLVQQFESVIGTHDPDLSSFKARGGKLIGFHGTVCCEYHRILWVRSANPDVS